MSDDLTKPEIAQQTKKQLDAKAIKFVVILFVLYLFFSQGNLFMNSVMSPGGRFYNASLAENFDYIQGLKTLIIVPSTWLINLFGFFTVHNEMDIMVVNGPYLRVNYSCLGLGVMSFLAAFVVAFPIKWKSTWPMLLSGILSIYILNVIRIAGLGILFGTFHSQRNYFEYHHEIFNVLVYMIIFVLLYIWIRRNTKKAESQKP
ncbi:exosortase/archaeosortase family protein [Pedobacter sp. UYEF25]